jgi:S-adenosylmethionine/arginine decarboxylase-like enzyme
MALDIWGYHLILDVKGCQLDKARDPEYIAKFVKDLVIKIDMVPFGEPQLVHFADNTDKAGWTVIQLITTSNITGHFLDHNGDLYLDVFSCKQFEQDTVTKAVDEYFKPERIRRRHLFRGANFDSVA